MPKSILTLAFEAGVKPFDMIPAHERDLGELAATLLHGRNRYFDREYRKKWGVKVHHLEVTHSRLLLGVVESAAPPNGPRRFRAVLFRCCGHVLYQTPDHRVLDKEAAIIDLRYFSQLQDDAKILHDLCAMQLRIANKMRDAAERCWIPFSTSKVRRREQ